MLIGYVSDERYVALPDTLLEFERNGQSVEARSRATGAVYADLAPGPYKVTLYRAGYGQKSVQMTVATGQPHHFRCSGQTPGPRYQALAEGWPHPRVPGMGCDEHSRSGRSCGQRGNVHSVQQPSRRFLSGVRVASASCEHRVS